VAILPTMMAAPITAAGQRSPLGPLGITITIPDAGRAPPPCQRSTFQ
jgi:hypothetical protein